jgi:hypothetical protein
MDDLTYEFQRMVSRSSEIRAQVKAAGPQAAWEKYSRDHGLDERRFRTELGELRSRFEQIGSAKKEG